MTIASRTFITTPAIITKKRCHAGLVRNSSGLGGCFICSLSIDSSIMPAILQYPPSGSQPSPYSVSPRLNLKIENHGSKKI